MSLNPAKKSYLLLMKGKGAVGFQPVAGMITVVQESGCSVCSGVHPEA